MLNYESQINKFPQLQHTFSTVHFNAIDWAMTSASGLPQLSPTILFQGRWYGDGAGNTKEKNSKRLLPNPNVLVKGKGKR